MERENAIAQIDWSEFVVVETIDFEDVVPQMNNRTNLFTQINQWQ